jgi:hypothetical protein
VSAAHHREHTPPSAAGFLEPYGLRVRLGPAAGELAVQEFLTGLLDDLAAACEAAGATVIGHLKCFMSDGDRRVHCNLTSRRTGARCSGHPSAALSLEPALRLDLAVLVYGLSSGTIDRLTRQGLDSRLVPLGIPWEQI